MSIVLVQSKSGGHGYVNSFTETLTSSVTVGSTLIASITAGDANTIASLIDDKGNTWNLIGSDLNAGKRQTWLYYAYNVAAGSTTITLTWGASQFADASFIVREYSGLSTTDPLDKSAHANDGGSAGTTHSCGTTAATTQAVELIIVAAGIETASNTDPVWVAPAGYGNLLAQLGDGGGTTFTGGAMADKTVSSTGTQTGAFTTTASKVGQGVIATFGTTNTPAGPTSAISILQTITANSNGTGGTAGAPSDYVNTLAIPFTSNNAAGNYLSIGIVTSSQSSTNVSTVTDSRGNTWTKRKAVAGTGSLNIGLYYYDSVNCAAGANTVTVTLIGAQYDTISVVMKEYSGIVTSSQVDVSASAVDSGAGYTHSTGTTSAIAQANELIVALCGTARPETLFNFDALFPGYNWNLTTSSNLNNLSPDYSGMAYADRVSTATGTQTATFQTSDVISTINLIICIKGSSTSIAALVPDAPVWVVASTDSNRAYVSWNAPKIKQYNRFNLSTSITGFNIKRSTDSGSGYTTIATGVTNSFYDDTGVTNGTTYYYVVTATSSGGTSSNSAEATAVVSALPTPHADRWYAHGTAPTGVSQTTILSHLRAHWDKIVTYMVTQTGATQAGWGAYRITVPDQGLTGGAHDFSISGGNTANQTASESIGYGMIAALYMSNRNNPQYDIKARSYFNGMMLYYQFYGHPLLFTGAGFSGTNSGALMNWCINSDGTVQGKNGATDGDLDVVFAMVMAHRLYGSTGAIDYITPAKVFTRQIRAYEFTSSTSSTPNLINNGDGWNPPEDIIYPDYFRPGYHDLFQYHTTDTGWTTLKNAMWSWLSLHFTSVYSSGLVPDGSNRAGTGAPSDGLASFNYSYNAIRMGFGYTLDYLWNGTAAAYNNQYKMASSAITRSGNSASNLGQTSTLAGSSGATNQVFASGYGSAATVDASTAAFAGAVATYIHSQVTENSYFGLFQGFLNLLVMSGEFTSNFGDIPPDPNPPSVTSATASFLMNFV